jgi:hypothetical protein
VNISQLDGIRACAEDRFRSVDSLGKFLESRHSLAERPCACPTIRMVDVSQEKALIFRITHIDNVPRIIERGLYCRNTCPPESVFREIGNQDLIQRRRQRVVPINPGGTLSDYIPFYFTPLSPMLLNIKTGRNGVRQTPMPEIAILVSSLHRLREHGIPFVFTDRHAYLQLAQFSDDLEDLSSIEWGLLQRRDFKKKQDDLTNFEKYQAEALVHNHMPVSTLLGIACHGESQRQALQKIADEQSSTVRVRVKQEWYF